MEARDARLTSGARRGDLCARYELDMDPDSVPGLLERFDLRFLGEPI